MDTNLLMCVTTYVVNNWQVVFDTSRLVMDIAYGGGLLAVGIACVVERVRTAKD